MIFDKANIKLWLVWLGGAPSYTPKVVGSVPCQGTYLGSGFDPWTELIQEATTDGFFLSH